MNKGLVHIYTGDGKGKTTAGAGLALRALGHGLKVCYAYFHKRPEKYGYTEINNLEKLGADIFGIAKGHPFCDSDIDPEKHAELAKEQFRELIEYAQNNSFNMLIIDEVIVSVRGGYLPEELLVDFIKNKPRGLEVILTGRGASETLIELADYVSEVKKVKHPFDKKITAREGIEY